ncbi:hypothetical protein AGMMS50276_23380 [Synergistales bacterium]|nr:hypothetical protein AGMMS50276_23380 [Synergistales bacterium]
MTATLYLTDIRRIAGGGRRAEEKIFAFSPERARGLSAFRREKDRLRSLAAGLLLREILGASKILYGEHGKPYVPGGPHFNVSHSGDRVALAVDEAPVGVDIEEHVEDDYRALARTAFHENELIFLEDVPVSALAQAFFDIWTLKESYLKMLGSGLSVNPASFAVKIHGQDACVASDPRPCLRLYDLGGYSLALCSLISGCPEKFEEVFL